MYVYLVRFSPLPDCTLGQLCVWDALKCVFECDTLELPWKDNKQYISCIPDGNYWLHRWQSGKFDRECLMVCDGITLKPPLASNRSYILVHPANFVHQLAGCIAPGRLSTNNTITDSKNALDQIMNHLSGPGPWPFIIQTRIGR